MEFLTILLSALIGIVSPVGLVVERLAENAIRDQLTFAEDLQVRVDNTPSHRLLQGRVDRVRIAGRGLFPVTGVRIAALGIETDAIDVDLGQLRAGTLALDQPLQAGVQLELTEADLNQALQSPFVQEQLGRLNLGSTVLGGDEAAPYELADPQVELLDDRRIRVQAVLQRGDSQLPIAVETGLAVVAGEQVQFIEPAVTVDGEAFPPQFVAQLAEGISRQYRLKNLEADGITARVLRFELDRDRLQLAAFVQVAPAFLQPSASEQD